MLRTMMLKQLCKTVFVKIVESLPDLYLNGIGTATQLPVAKTQDWHLAVASLLHLGGPVVSKLLSLAKTVVGFTVSCLLFLFRC